MQSRHPLLPQSAAELAGDPQLLLDRVGSADGSSLLIEQAAGAQRMAVKSAPDFRRFLTQYQADILFPFELPAIHEAYWYALRGAARELIALDQQIAQEIKLSDFAVASRSVGCRHLKQLRTLRDQRLVQRYLHAVESGVAHGWHTVVYGVILAVYSIPLRQGLMQYAELTLRGFIQAAGRSLRLDAAQRVRLLEQSSRELARATEAVITRPPRAI